jgi:hypothetical protein
MCVTKRERDSLRMYERESECVCLCMCVREGKREVERERERERGMFRVKGIKLRYVHFMITQTYLI